MNIGDPGYTVPVGAAAALPRERAQQRETLRRKLLQAIFHDPQIESVTNVSVVIDDVNGSTTVSLIGKVPTERGRERAAEIARNSVPHDAVVVNELGVG